MSDLNKSKKLLKLIQTRIQKLGPTNRSRWIVFSSDSEMTIPQFIKKLNNYGINITNGELSNIFKLVGITTGKMQFTEFVKFMQTEFNSTLNNIENNLEGLDLIDTLRKNRKQLILKLIEIDSLSMGTLRHKVFIDLCLNYGNFNENEIFDIIKKYDPTNCGYINYFILLAELCNPSILSQYIKIPIENPIPLNIEKEENKIFLNIEKEENNSLSKSPEKFFPKAFYNDDNSNTISFKSNKDYTLSSPRTNLDPLIFTQLSSRSQPNTLSPSGARNNLDPTIFGFKNKILPPPEQKIITADEIINAEHINDLTIPQLLILISKQINKTFKNARQSFSKWKGFKDKLDINDFRNGFARDLNLILPLKDLEILFNQYGGNLSLSSFIRMLSDAHSLDENYNTIEGFKNETDDEIELNYIASQIKGGNWENIIYQNNNIIDMIKDLKNLNINVNPEKLHLLASKYGKTGLINSLKSKIK